MSYSRKILQVLLMALPLHGISAKTAYMVLQNGRSLPASALAMEADKLVVKTAAEGYTLGQSFPLTMVDHIYGDKPVEINQAIALTLMGKPKEAQALLLPIVKEHHITAKFPGNFWLDAARALLVAYAINGNTDDTTKIGEEISDATPAHGIDSYVLLGKALTMPALTSKSEDRLAALRALTTQNLPDLCAYASFFYGNMLFKDKKSTEALEAYLAVPCLHPSGGLILNAAAELQAADLLAALGRPEEALALVESALSVSAGTVLADEASKRLTSLKK
jgi:tetratricopeptide (TPR) repeat protein